MLFNSDSAPLTASQRRRATSAILLGTVLAILDSSIANVALPAMSQDLRCSESEGTWIVSSYLLVTAISIVPFASLGRCIGMVRIHRIGLVVFMLASLACALASSLSLLVMARVVQGLGAGAMMSVSVGLIAQLFPREELGRGLGLMPLVVAVSAAAGPPLAALVLRAGSWPWLFLIGLPVGAVALALSLSALQGGPRGAHRFDVTSALLYAVCVGLFAVGLSTSSGGAMGPAGALLLASAASAMFFLRRQRRIADPMLPPSLLGTADFSLSLLAVIASFVAQSAALVALPFYLQHLGNAGLATVGLLMVAWPLAVALTSPWAGRLIDARPARPQASVGASVLALGLAGLACLPAPTNMGLFIVLTLACGAGVGLLLTPNNRFTMAAVPGDQASMAGGVLQTARLLGQALGAALAGAAFAYEATMARGVRTALFAAVAFAVMTALLARRRELQIASQPKRDFAGTPAVGRASSCSQGYP